MTAFDLAREICVPAQSFNDDERRKLLTLWIDRCTKGALRSAFLLNNFPDESAIAAELSSVVEWHDALDVKMRLHELSQRATAEWPSPLFNAVSYLAVVVLDAAFEETSLPDICAKIIIFMRMCGSDRDGAGLRDDVDNVASLAGTAH